jgi:hypothetical protein
MEKRYGDIEDIPRMDLPKPSIRNLRMMGDDSLTKKDSKMEIGIFKISFIPF